jgi:hypothetical protein
LPLTRCRVLDSLMAVPVGRLVCRGPAALVRSELYLFVRHMLSELEDHRLSAYDLTAADLPRVWEKACRAGITDLIVALQDRVLIAVQSSWTGYGLLPIDIRAKSPADWRCGARLDEDEVKIARSSHGSSAL